MKNILLLLFLVTQHLYSQIEVVELLSKNQNEDPTKIIFYADSLLLTNPSKKDVVMIKYYQAVAYQNNNNPKKALSIFQEILPLFKTKNKFYVRTLLGLSDANTRLKNYSEATNQALEALKIAKESKFYKLIASANTTLSFIHYANKDFIKSLEYLLSSIDLQKRLKVSVSLSASYNNIAIVYKNIGDFDKAIKYNSLSLEISKLKKDNIGIGKSYSNIGTAYGLIGDAKEAIKYYNLAIENNNKSNIINSIPYRNIGNIFLRQKDYDKAESYYLKALKIETDNNQNNLLTNIYKDLLKVAILKKDFKKALFYKSKSDSLEKINTRHQNEEKIKMLSYQHKSFQINTKFKQEQRINKKNKIIFGTFIGFLILGGLFVIQRNKNSRLKSEKEKIILEQQVLRSQMNPHFIFNTLSAIQNSLMDNEPIKSAGYLSRFAKLIRQNFDFINQKSILLKDEIDALQNYMDTQKLRYQDKFDYEINVFADVDINQVEIPPLLIQPFIENSIEHGFKNKKEKGKITINISKKDKNTICYEIIDNGKGYQTLKKDDKIHSIDIVKKRLKLIGNNDEKSIKMETSNKGTSIKFCLKND